MKSILDLIEKELVRQDLKWGKNRILDDRTWIAVLLEEVGEVARASLGHDKVNLKEELVQVAAVCVSFLHSIELSDKD